MRRILALVGLLLALSSTASAQAVIVPNPVPSCSNGNVLQWNTATTNFICASVIAASQPLSDALGLVAESSDPTKILQFVVDAITTSTTRTVTWPDANLTIPSTVASLAGNTFTGSQVMNGGFTATTGVMSSTLSVGGNVTLSGTGNAVGTITSGVWNAGNVTTSGKVDATGAGDSTFAGYVGIGTGVGAALRPLHIVADLADNSLYMANSNASPGGIEVSYTGAAPNGTSNPFLTFTDTGGTRLVVRSNGGINNLQINNVDMSDARRKLIDGPAEDGERAKFRQVAFVMARYADAPSEKPDLMLTAQQFETVYPDLVTDWAPGIKGVRTHALFLRALKVIQEMDAVVVSMQQRIDALEARR
jgi:hypothetical protein